jgi:hypothetical protein
MQCTRQHEDNENTHGSFCRFTSHGKKDKKDRKKIGTWNSSGRRADVKIRAEPKPKKNVMHCRQML